ncbi:hypothetical protein J4H86_05405 [Spiractinospora alimapuensis]|uniref:hypothetical protein n=1 Tax=Spiractinospora alimapuensis TaxID=2820884 RepID=UPI001F2018B8|nr:hypothetical protein [Spiractinospora alimapuensis]QVQ53218.1 hypothetical protein J4H86_05405 [Spiractinospora alimapuensis]
MTSAGARRPERSVHRRERSARSLVARAFTRAMPITFLTLLTGLALPFVAPVLGDVVSSVVPSYSGLWVGLSVGLVPAVGVALLLAHNRWVATTRP